MRLILAASCLLLFAGAKPKPLPPSLRNAERSYQIEVTKIEAEAAKKRAKAAGELIEAYGAALKTATKAGDFERGKVYDARIKQLQSENASRAKTPRAGGIRIISATWGVKQKWQDLTAVVARAANGRARWTVAADPKILGDPLPGEFGKALLIRYEFGGKVGLKVVYENRRATLP